MIRMVFCLAIVLLLQVPAAWASPFSVDDPNFGIGSLTRDTDQRLDFLDIIFSDGRSFNDVSSQFGVGGDFEGFRYATAAELTLLFQHAGIPNIGEGPFTEANFAPVSSLILLMGTTIGSTATDGLLADVFDPGRRRVGTYSIIRGPDRGWAGAMNGVTEETTVSPNLGSFLVKRNVVPEPSSLALVGIGTLSLAVYARRRRAPRSAIQPR